MPQGGDNGVPRQAAPYSITDSFTDRWDCVRGLTL